MADEVIAGRYRLDEKLGAGGMAEVWAAEDLELGRRVALKMLGPDADRTRFDREARAAAALGHPNVAQLYDYGDADGRPYMVLELLPGGTLEDLLAAGKPVPPEDVARIAGEIAAGLAHAHARGLVHRDLKPANVLFDADGRPKIADFGIARVGGAGTLTEAGTVLGTAAYISPEQARGETATAASDVYSFGVILYRMLAGRLPFESAQPMELVRMHMEEQPPPLSELQPDAPPALEGLAMASLAKSPDERPPDGEALAAELRAVQPTTALAAGGGGGGGGEQDEPPRRLGRTLALAALLLVGTAAGLALAMATTGEGRSGEDGAATGSTSGEQRVTRTTGETFDTTTPATVPATGATATTGAATTRPRTTTVPATTAATTAATTTAPTFTETAVTTEPPPTTIVTDTTTPPITTAP